MSDDAPLSEPRGELLPARVPPGVLWLFRASFVLVIAAYVVIVYVAIRAMQGNFGPSPLFVLLAIVPVLIMGVFLLPLVPLSELPENWILQQVPASRRRRGLCPGCAYPMTASVRRDAPTTCPECGSDGRVRPLVEPSWSALRRFAQLAIVGYLLGITVGEVLIQIDESRFRQEVNAARGGSMTGSGASATPGGTLPASVAVARPRQWPGSFATLRWSFERGFESEAPGIASRRAP